ncbi:MAG: hypothetical protein LBK76_03565 [Verrucomicrobiales bacterium]|jgi:hypothetical protein|nr:hypothetical protein [Verrucomicrobiales bacterium]
MSDYEQDLPPKQEKIISPFSAAEPVVPADRGFTTKLLVWSAALVLALAAVGGATVLVINYMNDPYRTMQSFPVEKFLENYRGLAGAKYKAEVQVEADLGWREGVGRLMLFTVSGDNRPIAVLVPEAVANNIYFVKGQKYLAELVVKEGGLIYANSCRKN